MFPNINNVMITSGSCKSIIVIPDTIEIEVEHRFVRIKGYLGELTYVCHKLIDIELKDKKCLIIGLCVSHFNSKKDKALVGTTRSLINGMIVGVTTGFIKRLQLVGIGYRAAINNNTINLMVGLSHSIDYMLPSGITATCPNPTEIILNGVDKQLIGQVAANLRALRPPEPFKGKGIRYSDEIIRIKNTKKR